MSRSTVLIRNYFLYRPSRRELSTSRPARSTSPQRCLAPDEQLKPFKDIPGPLALPMLRHSCHVLPRIGSFHHTVGLGLLEGLRDRYGDLVRLAQASRSRPVLYVFDPKMMQEVYDSGVTEPPRWGSSPLWVQRRGVGGRNCPIKGDETKAIWAAVRALLQDDILLQSYDLVFDDIAADFTRRLGELRNAENALNEELATEVHRWALETIGVAMLGIRLGCLDGAAHQPSPETRTPEKTSMDDHIPDLCSLSKKSIEELNMAERLVRCSREIADNNYLVRSDDTLRPDSKEFKNASKAFDDHYKLTEHFMLQALKELNSNTPRPEQVLLDKLRPLDTRILPLTADAFLAGADPLSQSALSMLHQLSLHAARQQRLHDEAQGAPEGGGALAAAAGAEALRLHPATGGVLRRAREPLAVGGYRVPEGVDIVLAHGVSSKSDKQFSRAKAFIPERWCSEGPLKASKAHNLAYLPFGESCPGTGVVGKMLAALATRVLDKYRLEWHGPPPNLVTAGVNKLQPPYYFVLQDAC